MSNIYYYFEPESREIAIGVKNIQQILNVKPEECAAFGDYMNDYEMKEMNYKNKIEELKKSYLNKFEEIKKNDNKIIIQNFLLIFFMSIFFMQM